MVVVKHETHTKRKTKGFCFAPASPTNPVDTLQVSEEIINELETTRNTDIPQYKYFENEMEKIESGDTSNMAAVKLDEYLGSIGVDDISHNVIERGGRYNGIC